MSILETLMLVALSFVGLIGMLATFAGRAGPSDARPRHGRSIAGDSTRSTHAEGSS
jgi:hypothetical protein